MTVCTIVHYWPTTIWCYVCTVYFTQNLISVLNKHYLWKALFQLLSAPKTFRNKISIAVVHLECRSCPLKVCTHFCASCSHRARASKGRKYICNSTISGQTPSAEVVRGRVLRAVLYQFAMKHNFSGKNGSCTASLSFGRSWFSTLVG